jgi:hypothetical protein
MNGPDMKATLNKSRAVNTDIIKTILANYPQAVKDSAVFAEKFQGTDARDTAYRIWKFLRSRIHYKKDPKDKTGEIWQFVRMPKRFLHDGTGDCKSFSLFTASVLANLKMPVSFRFAGYDEYDRIPTHVYVVTKDEEGKDLIIDGVYKHFAKEKPPTHYKDFPMKVVTLSGIGDVEYVPISGRRKLKLKKPKLKFHIPKGFLNKAKKVMLGPGRAAFLLLMKFNFHGFGTQIAKALQKNPAHVKKFWEDKIGGDMSQLTKAAVTGAKKKMIFGVEGVYGAYEEQGGVGSIALIAGAITAAAPVIAMGVKMLKSLGLGTKDTDDAAAAADDHLAAEGTSTEEITSKIDAGEVDKTPALPSKDGGTTDDTKDTHGSFMSLAKLKDPGSWFRFSFITGLGSMAQTMSHHPIASSVLSVACSGGLALMAYYGTKNLYKKLFS